LTREALWLNAKDSASRDTGFYHGYLAYITYFATQFVMGPSPGEGKCGEEENTNSPSKAYVR